MFTEMSFPIFQIFILPLEINISLISCAIIFIIVTLHKSEFLKLVIVDSDFIVSDVYNNGITNINNYVKISEICLSSSTFIMLSRLSK